MLRIFTDNPIVVTVQAGGENLAKYRYFNSLNDNTLNAEASFTVLEGVYGVFSSKMTKQKSWNSAAQPYPNSVIPQNGGLNISAAIFNFFFYICTLKKEYRINKRN